MSLTIVIAIKPGKFTAQFSLTIGTYWYNIYWINFNFLCLKQDHSLD